MALDPLAAFRLDDRVAIVTGASSGLGERFAQVLAAAGARVVLVARRRERLEAVAASLPSGSAAVVAADLAESGAPERVVEEALGAFGRLDVLVNNAGVSTVSPALEMDADAFRRELEIDLVAPYALARRAAAAMIDGGREGSVVNIGSILGRVAGGRLKIPAYTAAKGGLHNLTRELASQWARKGVRVNALAPAWFESEMTGESWADEGFVRYVEQGTPLGRGGRPHELDGALLFLASDASSYVTGQVLFVDGGWTAI